LGLPAFNREAGMSRTYYIHGRDTDYVHTLFTVPEGKRLHGEISL
jgi:hypothetical protein